MASALLNPSVSRPRSLRTESPPDLVSPDDGYDYNKIDIDPARKATKPRDLPSPVAVSEFPQDFTTTLTYEDQDNTYTETLPHIYQRQRGGWNAKVPDLETSKSNRVPPRDGIASNRSDQPKRFMLRWTMSRDPEKQTLLVHDDKEDSQLQDPDLQRRVFWK